MAAPTTYKEYDSREILLSKRNKHLRARLNIACQPRPEWFGKRLREETGLDKLMADFFSSGTLELADEQLDKLERFIGTFLAGGWTAKKGERVPLVPCWVEVEREVRS